MPYATAVSRDIAAPAVQVWELVSDLTRMGEWSPENTGGHWVGEATGPAVGAVFRGSNKNGIWRWTTECTVVECEPGRVFEFDVRSGPLAVASWRYELEDVEGGCRVTESWDDRRRRWFTMASRFLGDPSAGHAEQEMRATLSSVAAAVE